jgi:hypothetical protein
MFDVFPPGNSDPIDVLGDRDGSATLVVCLADGGPCSFVFAPTDELVDAELSTPLDFYNIVEASKHTRYMTVWTAAGGASLYWYVV